MQLLCLDASNNGIKETVQNKPVFDPDFHTLLIIKDEFKDLYSCIEKNRNFLFAHLHALSLYINCTCVF